MNVRGAVRQLDYGVREQLKESSLIQDAHQSASYAFNRKKSIVARVSAVICQSHPGSPLPYLGSPQ
ncbi:hypothetical protein DSO57_1017135 [Entomophthora muscae]|uniref:Uncharacterized protein n=1 Tax=Entomophthora muscae TaxID=34485 RepID=A0ACC2RJ73_9FUNG|nr:hypothetical protein DSO57_1017135 [Entomophthora muscae]